MKGALPLGYANDAREHANETHRLPLPPNAKGEHVFFNIDEEIKQFISPKNGFFTKSEKKLAVFTLRSEMRVIKSFIEQFHDESKSDTNIEVFSLEELFFMLKMRSQEMGVIGNVTVTNIHLSNILLEDDPNQNRDHLACQVSKLGSSDKLHSARLTT